MLKLENRINLAKLFYVRFLQSFYVYFTRIYHPDHFVIFDLVMESEKKNQGNLFISLIKLSVKEQEVSEFYGISIA